MDWKLGGLIALVLVTGCAERKIENAVRSSLIDPESARFDSIRVSDDGKVGCGIVNSKNRMGGYSGGTAFMVLEDQVYFPSGDPDEGFAVTECCHAAMLIKAGHQVDDGYNYLASCLKLDPKVDVSKF